MAGAAEPDLLPSAWQCKLPVCITLSAANISSPVSLPPLYVLAPRQGYLSTVAGQAWPHVQHVLPNLPGQSQPKPWLDFRGLPLRAHIPTGVLFDLLTDLATIDLGPQGASTGGSGAPSGTAGKQGASSGTYTATDDSNSNSAAASTSTAPEVVALSLPWELTIHYTSPPEELAGSWLSAMQPPQLYLNSLKESAYICRGSEGSAAVMRLPGVSQDAMWAAVEKCDVAAYRSVLASLKMVPTGRQGGLPTIPVRVYLRTAPEAGAGAGRPGMGSHLHTGSSGGGVAGDPPSLQGVWDSVACTSRPVPAQTPDGAWVSLGAALHALLPSLFPPPPASPPPQLAQQPPTQQLTQQEEQAGSESVQGVTPTEAAAQAETATEPAAGGLQGAGVQAAGEGSGPGTAGGAAAGGEGARDEQGAGGGEGIQAGSDSQEHAQEQAQGQNQEQEAGGQEPESSGGETVTDSAAAAAASPATQSPGPPSAGPAPTSASTAGQGGAGQASKPLTPPLPLPGSAAAMAASMLGASAMLGTAAKAAGTSAAQVSEAGAGAGAGQAAGEQGVGSQKCVVLVGGVLPPLETPIAWLHARLHAPDLFLYVVVRCDV